jgi:hypothetical protein
MVRAYTGWKRYDTDEELHILRRLLLFMPQMKLVARSRENGHTKRVYDLDTPLNRVLRLDEADVWTKAKLPQLRNSEDCEAFGEDRGTLGGTRRGIREENEKEYKDA